MGAPGTGSSSETYVETELTVTPKTFVASKPQQVARYLADDLQDLIRTTRLPLADALGIPPSSRSRYVRNPEHLVDLLFNDITRMLVDRLVTCVHLLLSEPKMDANVRAYKLLYHARYDINIPERSLLEEVLQEYGGRLSVGKLNPGNARFALVIDWAPRAQREDIARVRRPNYNFDWVPLAERYDTGGTVEVRRGGLGDVVVRIESMRPIDVVRTR